MSALTTTEKASSFVEDFSPLDEQQHITLDGASWEFYERLLRELRERNLRITFDQGRLEIMSPLPQHERPAQALGVFIRMLALELDIPLGGLGSTTFRRKDLEKGLEPDQCFYVQHAAAVRGKKRFDLRRDPPPDLVLEIDITHRSVPKMPIYAALGVPEVWRFDGNGLQCHLLRGGKYKLTKKGRAFPMLLVKDLEPFVRRFIDEDETTVTRSFRDWVRETFA